MWNQILCMHDLNHAHLCPVSFLFLFLVSFFLCSFIPWCASSRREIRGHSSWHLFSRNIMQQLVRSQFMANYEINLLLISLELWSKNNEIYIYDKNIQAFWRMFRYRSLHVRNLGCQDAMPKLYFPKRLIISVNLSSFTLSDFCVVNVIYPSLLPADF